MDEPTLALLETEPIHTQLLPDPIQTVLTPTHEREKVLCLQE